MRAFVSGAALVGLLASGFAGADPSLERLRTCMSEQNDAARLTCYDKEMGRASSGQPADFGMTSDLLRKEQAQAGIKPPPAPPPSTLSAKVAKISTRSNGALIVTLDNGQVWEQQEQIEMLLKVGDPVTITHGLLGSMWMDDVSAHRRTRVKRIE